MTEGIKDHIIKFTSSALCTLRPKKTNMNPLINPLNIKFHFLITLIVYYSLLLLLLISILLIIPYLPLMLWTRILKKKEREKLSVKIWCCRLLNNLSDFKIEKRNCNSYVIYCVNVNLAHWSSPILYLCLFFFRLSFGA